MAEPARETLDGTPEAAVMGAPLPADRVLEFPGGLIGFPDAHHFALLESSRPGSPFRCLACVDLPEIRFVVCAPGMFGSGYVSALPLPPDLPREDAAVLIIVTVPADGREMTANLMAPIIIDCRSRRGRQLILEGGPYSTRHPLLPAPPPAR